MEKPSLNFKFVAGQPLADQITAARLNALLAGVKRAQPPAGVKGARLTLTDEGWSLAVDPGAVGSQTAKFPFKVTVVDAAARTVSLEPGPLNNTIPLVSTDRMYVLPRPELTLPNVATAGIFLKVTVDGSMEATAVEIIAAEIDSVESNLDLQSGGIGYDLIASAWIEGGEIVSIQQYIKTKVYHRAYLKHIFWT